MDKKKATDSKFWHFNMKLTEDEHKRIEALREAIQRRIGPNIRATQKTVILEALERLEGYYSRLERDKTRER